MPNNAIETFRVVMSRNTLEELLRLESIRKKPLERQHLQRKAKKGCEKIPNPEGI
jgi:hypothetical protein